MFGLSSRAAVDALIIIALGVGVLWRGYRRRRAYWSARSWISFGVTLGVGIALMGFTMGFSAAVDNHSAWVGVAGSNTRGAWIVLALGGLVGGSLITSLTLFWFASADPTRPFPFLRFARRRLFLISRVDRLPAAGSESRVNTKSYLIALFAILGTLGCSG